jgi:hypothetical protein
MTDTSNMSIAELIATGVTDTANLLDVIEQRHKGSNISLIDLIKRAVPILILSGVPRAEALKRAAKHYGRSIKDLADLEASTNGDKV